MPNSGSALGSLVYASCFGSGASSRTSSSMAALALVATSLLTMVGRSTVAFSSTSVTMVGVMACRCSCCDFANDSL